MKRTCCTLVSYLLLISTIALCQVKPNTVKPWTYWWWMGSAVNERDITRQLEQLAGAGLGGVHVIPIYGVKGAEKGAIPFLSERWLAVFAHTVREANRLGMGVDLSTGTGWPFGGPNVTPDMAAQQWKREGSTLVGVPTRQRVKRAAPGGEGLVVDPFERQHLLRYLARFDSALARLPQRPRALYNDSYEVYGANWTTRFRDQFRQRRGYDLLSRLPEFTDTTNVPGRGAAGVVQVRRDYHETIADLLRDEFTAVWTNWARQRGYQTRNQAHGSPGNLLDLYALADIPETESFGSSRFPIPGLRVDENYEVDRFGTPHPLAMKFASSAAHLLGKPLVSSETTTWLADHFKVSLSQIKPQIDELFTAGINHVFYHGTTYSPPGQSWPDQAWPGNLFYASTNYGPSSHNWPFLPLLNRYVTRCQTRLQNSRPDNDLLVYFPIHDLWARRSPSAGGVHLLEVHHVDRWLLPMPFGRFCDSLRVAGYAFDYVSDALLDSLTVGPGGLLRMPGGTYKALMVPPADYLPERTRQRLAQLAAQGARIAYDANLTKLGTLPIRREGWAAQGLSFIRKKVGAGTTRYFIANLGNQFREGWVKLSVNGSVSQYDPLTDQTTYPARQSTAPTAAVWLRLLPGQSCFLSVAAATATRNKLTDRIKSDSSVITLNGPWQMQFGAGRPALRSTHTLPDLVSWTTLGDSTGYFWGKARYTTTFDLPGNGKPGQPLRLTLGDVREVAEVRLNGRLIGTAWCLPYELTLPAGLLKPTGNRLDIDVTNLSANYMRLRDGQKPDWKIFHDINIVDIRYRPFDATRWQPVPSGLLGPVTVVGR